MTGPSRELIFVAASGLAREALSAIRAQDAFTAVGFLDDSASLAGATVDGLPVLGPTSAIVKFPAAQIVVCAGRGVVREQIVDRLTALGVSQERYATLIDPTVNIPPGCEVGAGAIVLGGVRLTTAVSIGRHAVVMPNVTLTHDCVLEDFATACAGVTLGGNVLIQRGAYLGMNASVRQGTVVGAAATLGMGSALLGDLPAGQTWAGVPARPLDLPGIETKKLHLERGR